MVKYPRLISYSRRLSTSSSKLARFGLSFSLLRFSVRLDGRSRAGVYPSNLTGSRPPERNQGVTAFYWECSDALGPTGRVAVSRMLRGLVSYWSWTTDALRDGDSVKAESEPNESPSGH